MCIGAGASNGEPDHILGLLWRQLHICGLTRDDDADLGWDIGRVLARSNVDNMCIWIGINAVAWCIWC